MKKEPQSGLSDNERLLSNGAREYFFDGNDQEAIKEAGEISYRYHKTGSLVV